MAAEIERLVRLLARLPGLGPRSAQRAALAMLKRRDTLMLPLADALRACAEAVRPCSSCGNLDSLDPCGICRDPKRDAGLVCVVAEVEDLWALERAAVFKGRYHVLGGAISPLDGIGPEDLRVQELLDRVERDHVTEVILATNPNLEGNATAMYVAALLKPLGVTVTRLASGLPVGGDLEYADEVTLSKALENRREM